MSLALSRSFARVAYVGAATVGASAWWFMESSEGPKLNYWHLVSKHIIHTYLISLSLFVFLSFFRQRSRVKSMWELLPLARQPGGICSTMMAHCCHITNW